jgi:hypothetical protein
MWGILLFPETCLGILFGRLKMKVLTVSMYSPLGAAFRVAGLDIISYGSYVAQSTRMRSCNRETACNRCQCRERVMVHLLRVTLNKVQARPIKRVAQQTRLCSTSFVVLSLSLHPFVNLSLLKHILTNPSSTLKK